MHVFGVSDALSKTHPNRYDFKEKLKEVQPIYTFNTTATNLWIYTYIYTVYQWYTSMQVTYTENTNNDLIHTYHLTPLPLFLLMNTRFWKFQQQRVWVVSYILCCLPTHAMLPSCLRRAAYLYCYTQLSAPQFMLNSPQNYVVLSVNLIKSTTKAATAGPL